MLSSAFGADSSSFWKSMAGYVSAPQPRIQLVYSRPGLALQEYQSQALVRFMDNHRCPSEGHIGRLIIRNELKFEPLIGADSGGIGGYENAIPVYLPKVSDTCQFPPPVKTQPGVGR
ncbi:MAG TPA: hypothetical protein VIC02_08220 [Kineobactrum sp.]